MNYDDLHVISVPQAAPLGRQVVHDPRSKQFPADITVDTSTWNSKSIRLYEPRPIPNQTVGCCTGVAKASQFNATGNRVRGQVLGMDTALRLYSHASKIDPFPGAWPPTDTGSSGLASAKAAQHYLLGGAYTWLFGGADQVVQAVIDGWVVSVGTWWYSGASDVDEAGFIQQTGRRVGGHQWVVRGYSESRDALRGRCWWGPQFGIHGEFWIKRSHLNDLLLDNGDAHIQQVA